MNIGLIGLGAAGRNHLDLLSRMPEVTVAGIADLNAAYVEDLAARYRVPLATTDPAQLLADPAIETCDEPLAYSSHNADRGVIYRGFIESVAQSALVPWLASSEDGLRAIEVAQAAIDSMMAKGVISRRDVGPAANWCDTRPPA